MNRKYSLLIRVTCGVLGILGLIAIGYNAVQEGGIQLSFLLFAELFAAFIFFYVAIFSVSPLDIGSQDDPEHRR